METIAKTTSVDKETADCVRSRYIQTEAFEQFSQKTR